jgi:NAD(P)-dependent dehydrogenase (short-subunit alcohol dehydrogenase family)
MINPLEMKERKIIVTGASSGIGRETSILLSKLGANLVLVSRDENKLKKTYDLLEGSNHFIISYDFGNLQNISNLVELIVGKMGKISGLVHSAGLFQTTLPFNKIEMTTVMNIFNVNLFAFFELAKAITRKGNYSDNCSLVGVSSASALVGNAGLSAYGASKAALNNLVKTMALELSKKKIRVNTVSAAYVKTEMLETTKKFLTAEQIEVLEKKQPLGFGEPIDVANAIVFLLSDASRQITGTTMIVDGGYTAL